jgi:hypothetical protein
MHISLPSDVYFARGNGDGASSAGVVSSCSTRPSACVAMGRFDVAWVGAAAYVYDPVAHYKEVRHKWIGVSITYPATTSSCRACSCATDWPITNDENRPNPSPRPGPSPYDPRRIEAGTAQLFKLPLCSSRHVPALPDT